MRNSNCRTYIAGLLFVAYLFAYADRQVVNILIPALKQSLHLSLVQASILQGPAFALFFAFASVPLGIAADRYSRRNLLSIGIALWSLATIGCGLSNTFWELFLSRFSVGVGEACLVPASISLLADIYSPEHRGRAIGLVQAGTPLGTVTAMLAGGWLLTWFESTGTLVNSGLGLESWQGVFLILGIPGFVLAALLMGIREPARRGISAKMSPTRWIGKEGLFGESGWALASILSLHSLLGIEAYAILAWMPSILMGTYGRSAAAAGSITAPMIVIGGFGAYILSGVFSDALKRWRPHYGRIFLPAVMIPLAIAAMVWNCLDSSIVSLTTGMSIALFTGALVSAADVPAFQAIVPGRLRGQAMGIFTLVSNLLGLGVGPTLVAAIAEHLFGKDGLRQALIAVCMGTLIAALAIWPIVRSTYVRARKFEIEELH